MSGQQHGSVYWKKGSRSLLTNLCSNDSLVNQLKDAFSINGILNIYVYSSKYRISDLDG